MIPLFDQRELLIRPSLSLFLRLLYMDGQKEIIFDQREFLIEPNVSLSMSASSFVVWTDGNIIRPKGVSNRAKC